MFRNGYQQQGDVRKPITGIFQEYCEEIYRPIIFAMLFGSGPCTQIVPSFNTAPAPAPRYVHVPVRIVPVPWWSASVKPRRVFGGCGGSWNSTF